MPWKNMVMRERKRERRCMCVWGRNYGAKISHKSNQQIIIGNSKFVYKPNFLDIDFYIVSIKWQIYWLAEIDARLKFIWTIYHHINVFISVVFITNIDLVCSPVFLRCYINQGNLHGFLTELLFLIRSFSVFSFLMLPDHCSSDF